MLRAFVQIWSGEAGGEITTPIADYLEANDPGFPYVISNHYPRAQADGVPDKPRVLSLVWQPTGATDANGNNIEALGNLGGVYMLPAYRFQKPISEIPAAVRNDVRNKLKNRGIPLSALSGLVIYGDFLRKVAKYFEVKHRGFGSNVEINCDAEFGDG